MQGRGRGVSGNGGVQKREREIKTSPGWEMRSYGAAYLYRSSEAEGCMFFANMPGHTTVGHELFRGLEQHH